MSSILKSALEKANTEVGAMNIVDPEFRKIAFSKAVDYYLKINDESSDIDNTDKKKSDQSKEDFWGLLASASTLDVGILKDIYFLKNDQILLVISSVPGELKADRQQNLAVLILFAYQGGKEQEWVSSGLLAEAAKHTQLYDTSKFSKNLRSSWFRSQGVKRGVKYKLSGPGITAAKNLLIEMGKNHE